MTQRPWPVFTDPKLDNTVRQMLSTREEDIADYTNLPNQFIRGRKVDKLPASSADYDPVNDHVGDVNWDLDYLYILVSDPQVPPTPDTARWCRVALDNTW